MTDKINEITNELIKLYNSLEKQKEKQKEKVYITKFDDNDEEIKQFIAEIKKNIFVKHDGKLIYNYNNTPEEIPIKKQAEFMVKKSRDDTYFENDTVNENNTVDRKVDRKADALLNYISQLNNNKNIFENLNILSEKMVLPNLALAILKKIGFLQARVMIAGKTITIIEPVNNWVNRTNHNSNDTNLFYIKYLKTIVHQNMTILQNNDKGDVYEYLISEQQIKKKLTKEEENFIKYIDGAKDFYRKIYGITENSKPTNIPPARELINLVNLLENKKPMRGGLLDRPFGYNYNPSIIGGNGDLIMQTSLANHGKYISEIWEKIKKKLIGIDADKLDNISFTINGFIKAENLILICLGKLAKLALLIENNAIDKDTASNIFNIGTFLKDMNNNETQIHKIDKLFTEIVDNYQINYNKLYKKILLLNELADNIDTNGINSNRELSEIK